jgi:hypothetical protein
MKKQKQTRTLELRATVARELVTAVGGLNTPQPWKVAMSGQPQPWMVSEPQPW